MKTATRCVVLGAAIAAATLLGLALREPARDARVDSRERPVDAASSTPALSSRPRVPSSQASVSASYAAAATDGPDHAAAARSAAGSAIGTDARAEPVVVAPDAAHHLADALRNGDERSPPIVADAPPIERATPAELADPAAYRRYERRSQAKLYRAFEQEAVIALNDIDRDIQRGRAAGLSAEQIAEGEEKQRKLAETLERMRQGELGND